MRLEYTVPVVKNERLTDRFFRLTFRCPEIAAAALPGQFVNVGTRNYLRRPLAVAMTDGDLFTVGVEIKGEGTRFLNALQAGDTVNILGPLGHGFNLEDTDQLVVIGGGTGIFPLELALQRAPVETAAIFGFRSLAESFHVNAFGADPVAVTSEAGDLGIQGTVLDGLSAIAFKQNSRILCVGPRAMMEVVAAWAEARQIPCEVSLEERMACGIGLCLTCVCKTKSGDGFEHSRSCLDGPVYDSRRIVWR